MDEATAGAEGNGRGAMDRFLKFDVATLYEAAGQQGMVDPGIKPAWPGARVCGPALTVQLPAGDNLMLHHAVATASAGSVIVADVGGYLQAGAWGEILTVAAQARGLAGLVIDGAVRDIDAVAALGFPIFSRGLAVGACTKKLRGIQNGPLCFGGVRVRPGDLVVGGVEGLVVIPADRVEAVYHAALDRHEREQVLIRELRSGKTTLDLLGLRKYFQESSKDA